MREIFLSRERERCWTEGDRVAATAAAAAAAATAGNLPRFDSVGDALAA